MRERFEELLEPGRVIDHPLERRLYSRDGSIAMGDCGLVVLPETTDEVVACVRLARRDRRAGGAARVGHRPLRRRRPARRRHRPVGRAHDAHPRGRPRGALRARRARRAEPRPVDRRAPPGPALRPRPLEPAGLLDRRQRRDQRGRPALPGVGRHRAARARHGDRAGRRRGAAARRHRPRPPRVRPAGVRGGRRGDARRGHRGDRAPHAHPGRTCARCSSTSPPCAPRARPSGASSRPGSSPPRWR